MFSGDSVMNLCCKSRAKNRQFVGSKVVIAKPVELIEIWLWFTPFFGLMKLRVLSTIYPSLLIALS